MSETINFGIDLGTTNSSIACCEAGTVKLFNSPEGSATTPSVVYIGEGGRMMVGQRAYDVWVQDPRNTQAEFKRWMGYNDRLTFPASGRQLSAEELSAEVLKALRADVQRATGEIVSASVITVPAAFGSLQCEATSRAAKLAGLDEAPLLQEPIAAAIAYGATRGGEDQRWMVFDLGGGTLDIAIVSTRNGQLTVLEHQGNNRLGSKDMDRAIANKLLLPPLASAFAMPDPKSNQAQHERLMRALIRQAEKLKIALSTKDSIDVELTDIGSDTEGKSIELKLTITRAQLEEQVRPLVDKCMALAKSALSGARTTGANLDRVLLVGGPTQMPIIRSALASEIGAKLDFSQDPMTVVARGAALYASTVQRTVAELTEAAPRAGAPASAASSARQKPEAPSGIAQMTLSFERASGTVASPVAGILPDGSNIHEIKIDSESGLWTSGWIAIRGGMFETQVMLDKTRPITKFLVSARDKSGNVLAVLPRDFSIAYMLPIAAPPLPHTIALELSTNSGISTFDTVFKRHSPLPAEVRKTYRSDRTLRPSEPNSTLPIKFWEIEVSDDPQEKWWAGAIHIRADRIRRPIPEGSDLELTVKIDQSRKMTVEVFVPLLNQSFVEGVYIPDPPSARSQIQQQFDLCFDRIEHIERLIYELDREDVRERAVAVRENLEKTFEEANTRAQSDMSDPDAEMEVGDSLKRIRLQLTQLEEQLESAEMQSSEVREMRGQAKFTQHVVSSCGNEAQQAEMTQLMEQMNRYIESEDHRGLAWVRTQMIELRGMILDHQPWYWQNVLAFLKRPERRFANRAEAEVWLRRAEEAERAQQLPNLRDAVIKVWEMQPPDQVELSKQQAAQSGLRPV